MRSAMLDGYRSRRIAHINGNILLASIAALLLTAPIIGVLAPTLGSASRILVATAVVDALLDLSIFATLHAAMRVHRPLLRDVATIQLQRILLTPVFYGAAMGLQWMLLQRGMPAGWSVLVAYGAALVLTRIAHTVWGMRTGLFDDRPR